MLLPYTTLEYYGPGAASMEVLDAAGSMEGSARREIRPSVAMDGTGTAPVLRPYRGYAAALVAEGLGSVEGTPHKLLKFKLTVNVGAVPSAEDVAQAIWQSLSSKYNSPGTMGQKLNSASAAGDPWTAELPGTYPAGSAGNIVGNPATGGGLTLAQFVALK